MKGFNPTFRKTCGAMLESRGFKRFKFKCGFCDINYFRVVNDVLHTFGYILHPMPGERGCEILFGVAPFCGKIEFDEDPPIGIIASCPYWLKAFTDIDREFFYTSSENGLNACMEEISEYMTKYMFPFFDRADSCKTAMDETLKLEKLLDDVNATQFRLKYQEEQERPLSCMFLWQGDAKYFMALKNGNYDYAIKHQKMILSGYNETTQQSHNRISNLLTKIEKMQMEPIQKQRRKGCGRMIDGKYYYVPSIDEMKADIEHTQDYMEHYMGKAKSVEDELARLESRDVEYYNKMLMENEAKSREVLKEVGLI